MCSFPLRHVVCFIHESIGIRGAPSVAHTRRTLLGIDALENYAAKIASLLGRWFMCIRAKAVHGSIHNVSYFVVEEITFTFRIATNATVSGLD